MRRLVIGGVFLQLALLIIGLTWIRPLAGSEDTRPGDARPAATGEDVAYRTYGDGSGNIVEVKLDAVETVQEIAPDVRYNVWTFGGTAPGPVIRVREGDTVRFTLTNKSTLGLSHSIDFHAAQTPWDVNYQPVAPGETLTFDWVARFPGVFMYHCGVPPVLHHIANGMYGAIIVEPKAGLEPAREYVLVSSEVYATDEPAKGVFSGDVERMTAVEPSYVVFNGRANQYLDAPLEARPNELIRIWVMNAGPTLTNAFHVIGAVFDYIYPDGNPTNVLNGMQTWGVDPGGGAMFELTIPDEGLYPFVTHSFAYTGLGAVGVIKVSADAPPAPESYPPIADPFDGGLTPAEGTVAGTGGGTDAGGGSGEGSGGGDTGGHEGSEAVALTATISGFDPADLDVREGVIALVIENLDAFGHDFTIDELGLKQLLEASSITEFTFEAEPGTYEFYCSIPGHREAGMVGTVTVLPAEGH